jgi:RNA polymerase II subunit A small phosphatase-like protein
MKNVLFTNIKLLGKQFGSNIGKKTLVLDLDETLIHSKFGKDPNAECSFFIYFDTEYYQVNAHKRPYLDEFLDKVHELFEIVFYSSSVEAYANNIIDFIDPQKWACGRLFRDS